MTLGKQGKARRGDKGATTKGPQMPNRLMRRHRQRARDEGVFEGSDGKSRKAHQRNGQSLSRKGGK